MRSEQLILHETPEFVDVTDESFEQSQDSRHAEHFNLLDLLEGLEEAGFDEIQLSLAARAIRGERICLSTLRQTDWNLMVLSKDEFKAFEAQLPAFRRELADLLILAGIRAYWTAQERAGVTSYALWLGKDTEVTAAIERNARSKPKQRTLKVKQESPVSGTFDDLWRFHEKTIRSIARAACAYHEQAVLTHEDLVQDVALELAGRFDHIGGSVFEGAFIRSVAKYRLIDSLRKINPGSRQDARLYSELRVLFDTHVAADQAEQQLFAKYPQIDRTRLQSAIRTVYDYGAKPSPYSYIEQFEGFELRDPDYDGPDSRTAEASAEAIVSFLDSYLVNSGWSEDKVERYRHMAMQRFSEGLSLLEISKYHNVTESRISQILNNEVIPLIRRNLAQHDIGSDDAADTIYNGSLF